jgi:hypothetical protein
VTAAIAQSPANSRPIVAGTRSLTLSEIGPIEMDWTVILSVFGGSAVFFGAAAWLTRSLVTHLLSKDVEKFKAELNLQHTLAIERTRSDLQRLVKEHEIKYERLHTERAERVAELYQHIVETNDAVQACLEAFEEKPERMRFDLAAEAIKRGDRLAEYVTRNEIYFSRSLARELRELYTCLLDVGIEYKMYCEDKRQNKDCSNFVNLLSEVQTDTRGALKRTEEEFRKLLGVEQDPED